MDIFITELADITDKINNENKESYIMGDFNIDLLKFQSHEKIKYFIELMLTTGCLPVTTKPTRVTHRCQRGLRKMRESARNDISRTHANFARAHKCEQNTAYDIRTRYQTL